MQCAHPLTLLDGMFTLGAAADVAGRARTDLAVAFSNAPVVSYTPLVFAESDDNDGSIGNTIAVALTGDTFVNASVLTAGVHYAVSGVPDGLGFKLERDNATHLTATLTNKATAHGSVNNTNLVLNLLDAAFTTVAATNITGATTNLAVNFFDLVGTNGWQSGSGSGGAVVTTETAVVTANNYLSRLRLLGVDGAAPAILILAGGGRKNEGG